MRKTVSIMAILGGPLLLMGCNQNQQPPEQNQATEAPKPVVVPKPKPTPVATPKPAKPAKPKPLPPTPDQEQVLDDADATGMTARVNRAANESTAPAADTNHD
jgi:PBP1b-binding outer membrane lipoprotein LpoB